MTQNRPTNADLSRASFKSATSYETNSERAFCSGVVALVATGAGLLTFTPALVVGGAFLAGLSARFHLCGQIDQLTRENISTIFKADNLDKAIAHKVRYNRGKEANNYNRLLAAQEGILIGQKTLDDSLTKQDSRLIMQQQVLALTGFYVADHAMIGKKADAFFNQVVPDARMKDILFATPAQLNQMPDANQKLQKMRDHLFKVTQNSKGSSYFSDNKIAKLHQQNPLLATAKHILRMVTGRSQNIMAHAKKLSGPMPQGVDYDVQRKEATHAAEAGRRFLEKTYPRNR